jgi:thioredoxin 1
MSNAVAVTDDTFDTEVLNSKVPVLVDFWAAWCGPCRAIAPAVDEIAAEYQQKLKVVKLDIDANGQVSMRFGIRGIPTLLLFKDGQVVETMVGAYPKATMVSKIVPHLSSNERGELAS